MELTELKNIGPAMERRLHAIGIHSAEELRALGGKEAYRRLKAAYPEVCAVFLYTLHGAVEDIDLGMLPNGIKDELKAYSDSLE